LKSRVNTNMRKSRFVVDTLHLFLCK
jgi:hypothetical protein